jgi:hypothetical protein
VNIRKRFASAMQPTVPGAPTHHIRAQRNVYLIFFIIAIGHVSACCFVDNARPPHYEGLIMTKPSLRQLFKLTVPTSATLFALSSACKSRERKDDRRTTRNAKRSARRRRQGPDDDRWPRGLVALPAWQFIRGCGAGCGQQF